MIANNFPDNAVADIIDSTSEECVVSYVTCSLHSGAKGPSLVGYSPTNANCQQTTDQRLAEKRVLFCMTVFMRDEYFKM